MKRGVFSIDRKLIDHPLVGIENPKKMAAWIWMLSEARWKDSEIFIKGKMVILKRGQLSCSYRFMANRVKMSIQEIRTFLKQLKTNTLINIENNTGQNIITICNYDTYQDIKKYNNTRNNKTATQQQHSSNTAATQTRIPDVIPDVIQEDKNIKMEFEKWWKIYPRKVGKGAARKSFDIAAKKTTVEILQASVENYRENKKDEDVKFIPHPATWLNQERWADEESKPSTPAWLV